MSVDNQFPHSSETGSSFVDPILFTARYLGDELCYTHGNPALQNRVDHFTWQTYKNELEAALPDAFDPRYAHDRVLLSESTADVFLEQAPAAQKTEDHTASAIALREAIIRINGLRIAKNVVIANKPLVDEMLVLMLDLETKRAKTLRQLGAHQSHTARQDNLFLSAVIGDVTPRHPVFMSLFKALQNHCAVLPVSSAPAQTMNALAMYEAQIGGVHPRNVLKLFLDESVAASPIALTPNEFRRKGFRWLKNR